MSICDRLGSACGELGLAFECECNRVQPRYRIALDGEPGAPVLRLSLRDDHDVSARLVDLDRQRRGLLLEVAVKMVKREPNFQLWLEEVVVERHAVIQRGEAWTIQQVVGVERVADVPLDDVEGSEFGST